MPFHAQVGKLDFAHSALTHPGRILDGAAPVRKSGLVPRGRDSAPCLRSKLEHCSLDSSLSKLRDLSGLEGKKLVDLGKALGFS